MHFHSSMAPSSFENIEKKFFLTCRHRLPIRTAFADLKTTEGPQALQAKAGIFRNLLLVKRLHYTVVFT